MKNNRKALLKNSFCMLVMTAMLLSVFGTSSVAASSTGLETVTLDENALYNGIVIPKNWVNYVNHRQGTPIDIPYLMSTEEGGYAPDIINIDVGRQLFVDDFLIDSTTLTTTYHNAVLCDEPVLVAEQDSGLTSVVLTSGGVWYDMDEQIYKMWYQKNLLSSSNSTSFNRI